MIHSNLKSILNTKLSPLITFGLAMAVLFAGCLKPAASLYLEDKRIMTKETLSDPAKGDPVLFKLDSRTEVSINRYGSIIRKYSSLYGLDWRLVLAIMKQESRFRHDAVSHKGAYGLMQIMPVTQMELAQKLGVEETISPYNNIRAGAFHLKTLLRMFEGADPENRTKLSLAAYNSGLSRIQDAQDIATYLGNDPNDWNAVRAALSLLSRAQYTLHKNVWENGKPRGGYFKDWQQTVNYVDNILDYYKEYRYTLT